MQANVYEGTDKGVTVRHMHFDSLTELDNADIPAGHCQAAYDQAVSQTDTRSSWWGIRGGLKAVKEAVRNGWPDGMERAQEALKSLKANIPRAKTLRRVKVRGPQGNELDIHRVYAGDLQRAWRGTAKQERFPAKKQGKKVTVAVELGISAMTNADVLFWRGAVACFLADVLGKQGYAVQVLGVLSIGGLDARNHNAKHVITIELKPYGKRLNLDATIACTGLAGFLRGHMFKAICCFDQKITSGLGMPVSLLQWVPPQIANHTNHMIYVRDVSDQRSAELFIRNESAKLLSEVQTSKRGTRR